MKVPTKASLVSFNFGQFFTLSTKLIKPKLSCHVPSPTQYHSFYRSLPIYIDRSKVKGHPDLKTYPKSKIILTADRVYISIRCLLANQSKIVGSGSQVTFEGHLNLICNYLFGIIFLSQKLSVFEELRHHSLVWNVCKSYL